MIKTLSHYTDKGRIERLELLVGSEQEVITESVTKTVGAGKDFESFHLALKWLESVVQASGSIFIVLDDGLHVIGGEGEFDDWIWTYYNIIGKNVTINSASANKTACIVTLSDYDDLENWPTLINFLSSDVYISDITFDSSAGGYPYPKTAAMFSVTQSNLSFVNSEIKLFNIGITSLSGSDCWLFGSTFDQCFEAISIYSVAVNKECTFSNCDVGIAVFSNGNVVSENVPTFINNTSDTSIPLNEIQYSGSYISDGTGALSFKA